LNFWCSALVVGEPFVFDVDWLAAVSIGTSDPLLYRYGRPMTGGDGLTNQTNALKWTIY
jgi:hypothetical protein